MRKDDGLKTAHGVTTAPEIVGTIKAKGGSKAFSYVFSDGSIVPAIMGGAGEGDGSNGNGGQDNAGNNGGNGGAQKVEFSPEQQAKVQELIDGSFSKAYGKAKQEFDAKLTIEIEKLKSGNGGQPGAEKKVEPNAEMKAALDALKTRDEQRESERQKEKAEALHEIKNARITKEIGGFDVHGHDEIANLVASHFDINPETKEVFVKGVDGSPKISLQTGEKMTPKEFLASWLKDRPHYQKAAGSQGAGSQGAMFGPGGGQKYNLQDPQSIRNMPKEDFEKLLKEGVNVHLPSGQTMKFREQKNPFLEARRAKFKQ